MQKTVKNIFSLFFICILLWPAYSICDETETDQATIPIAVSSDPMKKDEFQETTSGKEFTINDIIVSGNKYIEAEAIKNKIPYAIGQLFSPLKTGALIRSLYDLGYFEQINVMGEELPDNKMNLHVIVQEGKRIAGFEFEGNDHLGPKGINEKIDLKNIKTVHPKQIQKIVSALKKMYREKDYHLVKITPVYKEDGDTVTIIFNIEEGIRSFVKRVYFKGNSVFSSKTLRGVSFLREDWLLGFFDKSGSYQPEAVQMTKQAIEFFYQDHGYLVAKVMDVDVRMDEKTKQYFVTITVDEGAKYTIKEIHAPGNELLDENDLVPFLPLKPGQPYSRGKLMKSIEMLRNTWGEFGYVFADIRPEVLPDEHNKTVSITFHSELGNKIHVNRISIHGNKKTRDKIIRRQILMDEGELITRRSMERSKDRIEGLGYFDRKKGVNWKTTRIDDEQADLDLLIEEIKTGKIGLQIGSGGDPKSIINPAKGFTISIYWSDENAFGQGWQYNFGAELARESQSFNFSLSDPWLFDRPIYGGFNTSIRRSSFADEIGNAAGSVDQRVVGASFTLGFVNNWIGETSIITSLGVNDYKFANRPRASSNLPDDQRIEYQGILDRRFLFGTLAQFIARIGQDVRNHPMQPTKGYQWSLNSKLGISGASSNFGFFKFEYDSTWYTPLIGVDTLILGVHAHVGTVRPIRCGNIPFDELYHIGGPASVRGFNYGEIGPFWRDSSLGAQNAFWVNCQLIFPITPDYSTKLSVFYDGGAGWDTPDGALLDPRLVTNNEFNYRHSVGLSFSLLRPTPMTIDWAFKLDKRRNEKTSEVHFGAYREF